MASRRALGPFVSIAGLLSARATGIVLQVALLAVVGRLYGVGGLGIFQLFVSWTVVVAGLGAFGAPLQVLRDVSSATAAGDRAAVSKAARANVVTTARTAGLLSLAIAATQHWWATSMVPASAPGVFILVVAGAAFARALLTTLTEALKGGGRGHLAVFLQSAFAQLFVLGFVSAAAATGYRPSLLAIFVVHAMATATAAFIAVAAWARRRAPEAAGEVPAPEGTNQRTVFGSTQVLGLLAGNLAIVAMPLFLTDTDIGLFAAAQRLVGIAGLSLLTMSAHFSPRFAAAATRRDADALRGELRASQAYSIGLYAPFLAAFLVAPRTALSLFGSEFDAASPLLMVLALGQAVNAATGLVGFFLNMTGGAIHELRAMIISLLLYATAFFALISTHGALGVAAAMAIFLAVRNAVAWLFAMLHLARLRTHWSQRRKASFA